MRNFSVFLVLILIASFFDGFSAVSDCPDRCSCFQRTVRCVRMQLREIPRIPSDTAIIDLRYNSLQSIPSNAFAGLNQVHTIFLSENEIGFIKEDSLTGLIALKYLYLNNNRISQIAPGSFKGLDFLEGLFLENNDIWQLEPSTFDDLSRVNRLFLFGNKLTSLPVGIFDNLVSLKRLRLDNNPINCDCGVGSLVTLKKNTREYLSISLTCEAPSNLHQKSFIALTEQDFHCTKPQMIEEPHDMQTYFGQTVELPCTVIGDPEPEVVWMHNTNEISDDYSPRMQILDSGNLQIRSVDNNDVGIYECIGRNDIGETKSQPIRMIVNTNEVLRQEPPQFVHQPKDTIVGIDDFTVLDCTASGFPVPEIQWYFNGRQVSQSTQTTRVLSNGSLEISEATLRSSGTYKCIASNAFGSVQAKVKVEVKELPVFILAPQSQTVKYGQNIELECDAEGHPLPSISWTFNDQAIIPNERITLDNENTELIIKDAENTDSGIYTCIAMNENGESKSKATISVESDHSPPRILFAPYDLEAFSGTTIELPCKGDDDSVQIKWQKDGRLITENERFQISLSGSLYVKNATLADTGRYECSIKNEHGRATASGFVTIKSNDALAPGDRFVRVAFAEAAREIDLSINNTIESLFSDRKPSNPLHHGDLLRLFRFPKGEARQLARAAEIYERTLVNIRKHVQEGHNLSISSSQYEFKDLLSREHLRLVAELSGCMEHREMPNCTDMCYHSKYRSVDGTCNNLNNPTWGASLTAFRRIEKPIYENGFSMPIGWMKGKLYAGFEKPSARLVSTTLISTKEITPDEHITHMVMQWGQFVDHDLDHAIPSVSSESWDGIDCKKTCEFAPPCYPMEVPPDDPRVKNRRCIDLIRSSAICGSGMTSVFFDAVQPREQINQLTSYIDASQVYGFTQEFSHELRNLTTDEGLLRTGVHFPHQKDMLPFAAPQDGIDCRRNLNDNNMNCFVAGDIRANEQVGLLAMHTIWMREHNRIALKLKEINPHWDGDTLYQEARKIVGAQMQHITFNQWLPIVVGPSGMEKLGEYKGYNPSINPSIANEFATAAFRFGHTLINPILHRVNETYQPIPQGHLPLHKAFFAPWRIAYEGGVDPLLRGMFTTAAKLKKPDQNLNTELTEKLFLTQHAVALDLAAMNVQRGRDHGIPGYNMYRKFCNLTVAMTFDDLAKEISDTEVRRKMEKLYGHPDNIDIFVGGILEDPVEGGKIGPLFQCLIVDQFRRLRDGDRFFYENPSVFLPEQLQQIKQANLARVLCDNGDNINEITENVFYLPKEQGGFKSCLDIHGINLYFWQDCGSCDALPPLLKSYVPETYPKRHKRSLSDNMVIRDDINEDHWDMNYERIVGLEGIISSFQDELNYLQNKIENIEKTCNSALKNEVIKTNKKPFCIDESGKVRLNNESWDQDECTSCKCKRSQVTCIQKNCTP
ncbi:peroxidasin [Episyrphus balteatus]|uniref:peroxidasin n=1 Tax=Episyrphus balteatus TaxID=286459 RepID=UPI0024868B46|nr:peroxidasin [Episyrphus balteatus]